ncbi:type II toxin-antitoxin system Phd/YefM family antitoxin [Phreatobacter sp.]|uniref:type II toxin-antitoxin system Phd/YefM family antitoxin n=1 Tax=Phreatobacter sp. TaxID=1966341 RepID=UPI0025D13B6B|nr:type II toxin-antitoxin system prevent-host-death family antitoxin [Phreatobacter sp.]MBY0363413.1 type II toxin-antitoxin system prevent-host-death family antitoxin [Phreatobacter sp.]
MSSVTVVGTFEAKQRLSELLDRVERGEEVQITRNGKRIARLVPDRDEAINPGIGAFQRIRARLAQPGVVKGGQVTVEDILAWRDEGRR